MSSCSEVCPNKQKKWLLKIQINPEIIRNMTFNTNDKR